jgi:hypothetical protein
MLMLRQKGHLVAFCVGVVPSRRHAINIYLYAIDSNEARRRHALTIYLYAIDSNEARRRRETTII